MSVSRRVALLAAAAACRHRVDPPLPQLEASNAGTSGSGATETAGRLSVPPSARILGVPGMHLDTQVAMLPATASEPSVLLLDGTLDDFPEAPGTFIVRGDPPPGDVGIFEYWDGVSGLDYGTNAAYVQAAGDVDDDGMRDVWLGPQLFLGPLLGRSFATYTDFHAWIDGDGNVAAADFDADGDGYEDVLVSQGFQTAVIRYGPFEGVQGASINGEFPLDQVTQLGDYSGCKPSYLVSLLPDHLGPGHPAVVVGTDWGNFCNMDSFVYDLLRPRGEILTEADAIASYGSNGYFTYFDAGDLDADGRRDIVRSDLVDDSYIHAAPLSGFIGDNPLSITQVGWVDNARVGNVLRPLGDIDGDGVEELLAVWIREPDWALVVLFSPHTQPLDPSAGLELGLWKDVGSDVGRLHGDLDGDGLSDLVGTARYTTDGRPEDPGEIKLWYAPDLVAAWDEQRRLRGL